MHSYSYPHMLTHAHTHLCCPHMLTHTWTHSYQTILDLQASCLAAVKFLASPVCLCTSHLQKWVSISLGVGLGTGVGKGCGYTLSGGVG